MSEIEVLSLKVSRGYIKNYVYLAYDKNTGEAALIDPVWEQEQLNVLMEEKRITLSAILLTHSHPDHVDLAENLTTKTNCPVYMSQAEIDYYSFSCSNLVPLNKGDIIPLAHTHITPIFTPGHTKGSTCYMIDNNLFTGDTLFIEGCGLCWGKGADPADMFDSLQLLKREIPPETRIFPAHKYLEDPGMILKDILQYNIYLDFKNKEDFIKYRMRNNQNNLFKFK